MNGAAGIGARGIRDGDPGGAFLGLLLADTADVDSVGTTAGVSDKELGVVLIVSAVAGVGAGGV